MATVSGQLVSDKDRSAAIDAGDSGISNIPVVLQNIKTGIRLAVLTDTAGNYEFNNAPDGNYRIAEAYNTTEGVPSPSDFTMAVAGPIPIAAVPPVTVVTDAPTGATSLDCLTPNTLEAEEVRTIIIRGTVSQDAAGIISNTATVSSPTPGPDPTNNTSMADTPVSEIIEADVSVIKNANPNHVTPGNVITFTIIVSNAGPNDAENVILNDNITPFIIEPMFSTDGGATYHLWPGFLSLGLLPAGESRTVLIRGTVSGLAIGCLNNTAIVTSATPDPNLLNNTSSLCIDIMAADGEADLSVKKISNKKDVCCGGILLFTIVISNAGPSDSLNVVLTDSVINILKNPMFSQDNGLTFKAWPGSANLGTIPARTSKVILLKGCMLSTCSSEIINTAQVSSITPDPNLDNNISTVSVLIV